MDEVIKTENLGKRSGKTENRKYTIPFTDEAINNLKIRDDRPWIKVRFKNQGGVYLYWSNKKNTKKT